MPNTDRVTSLYFALIVVLLIAAVGILIFAPRVEAAPNAPADPVPCLPMATAGDEALYFCEGNFGPDCVWDPSPTFAAGVLTCEW